MKRIILAVQTLILSLLLLLTACRQTQNNPNVIGKPEVRVEDGILTPEVLWSMGRLGEVAVSPDKQHIAYSVRYFSIAENKGNTDLYVADIDGKNVRQITETPASEGNLVWLNERTLAYLAPAGDGAQMFGVDLRKAFKTTAECGSIAKVAGKLKPVQITDIKGGMDGFKLSPDKKRIAFIRDVQVLPSVQDRYPDMQKSSGLIITDLNFRHWDHWVTAIPHTFVADIVGGNLAEGAVKVRTTKPQDVLQGKPFEAPLKPFGGTEQFAWSQDGKLLAFTTKEKVGKEYAESTNSDVFVYNVEEGTSYNASEGNAGYDMNPVFSPDGRYLAWESMERDGYESDRIRLMLMDLNTRERFDATCGWEQFATGLAWSEDSRYIYFTSDYHATDQIYRLDVEKCVSEKACARETVRCLTSGVHDYHTVIPVDENTLIGVRMSMSRPDEIYRIDLRAPQADGCFEQSCISGINDDIFNQLDLARVESRWMQTTNGEQMQVWVIYPPHFDSTKKYPTLLYCEGGPQSTISQFWSYRWNMQIMAANGYIVVAPNRHGLPGFGMDWLEQISGDYGGQNMKDYLSAIDEMAKEPYVDKDKLGCVGASYGGFSVYWLAGHHDKRFKAFIAHDGMFNLEQQYLETEELFFENWDLGGAYWEKDNPVAMKSYANSPHRFVDKWDAPILIVHGELDYRIVASQGMSAFSAARIRGIPAELLIFPDENHWVLQPQNGIVWQRRFYRFLDRYVKGLSEEELNRRHHAEQAFVVVDPFSDEASVRERGGAKEVNTEKQVAQ